MADVLTVERITTPEQLGAAFEVRMDVFVYEQKVPVELELDDQDHAPTTTHVLVRAGDDVVGTGRLLTDPEHPGEVHIGMPVEVAFTKVPGGALRPTFKPAGVLA